MSKLDTNAVIKDFLLNYSNFKKYDVGITKKDNSEYEVKTKETCVLLVISGEKIQVKSYNDNVEMSDCAKKVVQSYVFQLFEKLKRRINYEIN